MNGPTAALARIVGVLSVLSGVAMAVAPARMGALYGFPPSLLLVRVLGVRDAAIGVGILGGAESTRILALSARAASDALDSVLLAIARRRESRAARLLRVGGALASSGVAAAVATAVARPAGGHGRAAAST